MCWSFQEVFFFVVNNPIKIYSTNHKSFRYLCMKLPQSLLGMGNGWLIKKCYGPSHGSGMNSHHGFWVLCVRCVRQRKEYRGTYTYLYIYSFCIILIVRLVASQYFLIRLQHACNLSSCKNVRHDKIWRITLANLINEVFIAAFPCVYTYIRSCLQRDSRICKDEAVFMMMMIINLF